MAYQVDDLTQLKHLLEFGDRFLGITDAHDERITALDGKILVGTKAEWAEKATTIPEKGTIIIYSDYATVNDALDVPYDVPNFKVGDGNAYLVDLPFSQDDLRAAIAAHIADDTRHLTPDDRTKLASSVSVSVDGSNLIFA